MVNKGCIKLDLQTKPHPILWYKVERFKMAKKSSTPSDALKKLEEQLTCPICLDDYTDPKTLPCLHSFCHRCLERLPLDVQGKRLFLSCPTCRTPTELPEAGVAGFPIAFLINNLTEVHSLLKKVSGDQHVSCDNCKTSDATGYCKQCTKFYCAECFGVHNKWAPFVDHTVISLEEVARTAFQLLSIKPEVTMKCSSHGKSLKIYCETCHDLICSDCTVRIHKGHEYDLINDTYDKHRQIIESSLEPVREQIVVVTEALTTLTQREKEITNQGETVKQEIHVMIKQIIDLLLQSERKLAEDVDLAVRHKLSMLSQQKRKAETTLGQLTDCFDFVEQGLKVGTPQQLLLAQPQMIDRTNSVIKSFKPESFQPLEQADIKLVKSKKIKDIHKSIGEVRYSSSISSCKVRNINHHLALMEKEYTSTIAFEFPDGSPVPLPPSHISCYLTPPDNNQPIECTVKESTQSGQYKVVFTPITRSLHQLHVRVHDINIPGSPLSIPVSISPKMRGNPVKSITGLKSPWGIDVTDDGLMIVSEHDNYCITVLDREGKKMKSFGSQGSGRGQFIYPSGIAVTSNRTILVVDARNHRIQELTMQGECIACIGEKGSGPLQFKCPRGITINKTTGQVFVADEGNHRIQVLNPDLTFSYTFGSNGSKNGQFHFARDVILDSKGFLYVTDIDNHRIQKFTPEGRFVDMFGTKGSKPGQLNCPSGITVDDNDLLYVNEEGNHRVSIFTMSGEFIHCFGEKGNKEGQLNKPRELSCDRYRYLYVCDCSNNRLVVY